MEVFGVVWDGHSPVFACCQTVARLRSWHDRAAARVVCQCQPLCVGWLDRISIVCTCQYLAVLNSAQAVGAAVAASLHSASSVRFLSFTHSFLRHSLRFRAFLTASQQHSQHSTVSSAFVHHRRPACIGCVGAVSCCCADCCSTRLAVSRLVSPFSSAALSRISYIFSLQSSTFCP